MIGIHWNPVLHNFTYSPCHRQMLRSISAFKCCYKENVDTLDNNIIQHLIFHFMDIAVLQYKQKKTSKQQSNFLTQVSTVPYTQTSAWIFNDFLNLRLHQNLCKFSSVYILYNLYTAILLFTTTETILGITLTTEKSLPQSATVH